MNFFHSSNSQTQKSFEDINTEQSENFRLNPNQESSNSIETYPKRNSSDGNKQTLFGKSNIRLFKHRTSDYENQPSPTQLITPTPRSERQKITKDTILQKFTTIKSPLSNNSFGMINRANLETSPILTIESFQSIFEVVKITKKYKCQWNISFILEKYNKIVNEVIKIRNEKRMSYEMNLMNIIDLTSPLRSRMSSFKSKKMKALKPQRTSQQSSRLSDRNDDSSRVLLTTRLILNEMSEFKKSSTTSINPQEEEDKKDNN